MTWGYFVSWERGRRPRGDRCPRGRVESSVIAIAIAATFLAVFAHYAMNQGVTIRNGLAGADDSAESSAERPRQDSNLRTRLRRAMLYPLSYEGRFDRRDRTRAERIVSAASGVEKARSAVRWCRRSTSGASGSVPLASRGDAKLS